MNAPTQVPTDSTRVTAVADLADPEFWRLPRSERLSAFARLRELGAPVRFTPRTGSRAPFHALVTHADVKAASRQPQVFASAPGVTFPEPAPWAKAVFGNSMVNMDGAEHAGLRRTISRAFTPRLLAAAEENIGAVARRLVDEMTAEGPGDFMRAAPARMPFEVICDLMGIPRATGPASRRASTTRRSTSGCSDAGAPGSGCRGGACAHWPACSWRWRESPATGAAYRRTT